MGLARRSAPAASAVGRRGLYVVPDRVVERASHVPPGRTLHLVDVENLMGGPFAGGNAMRESSRRYREAANVGLRDHVVIGCNPALALEAACNWPGKLLVAGRGPDGADLALLEQARDARWVAQRFDRVVIGSGDGIFCDMAAALRSYGVAVGVVAVEGSLSHSLARTAHFIRVLPGPQKLDVVA
jgi:hypothetical protein